MTNPAQGTLTPRTDAAMQECIRQGGPYEPFHGPLIDEAAKMERELTAAESALAEANKENAQLRRLIDKGRESTAIELGLSAQVDMYREGAVKLLEQNESLQSQLAAAQRDAELLNWLEENHFFSGTEGDGNRSLVWKFHTPNNGRQWQPLREKLSAEIALSATSAGEKGDGETEHGIKVDGYSHKWDRGGERCIKCGDKDWMGSTCSVPDSPDWSDQ